MINKKKITNFFVALVLFYFIYTPEFFVMLGFPIRSQYITVITFLFIVFYIFIKICLRKKADLFIDKELFVLFLNIFFASIYFLIVALLNSEDTRFLQNIYIIVQVCVIIFFLQKLNDSNNKNIKLITLFRLAALQGIISLIMLIIPSTKDIALRLYYLGGEENYFISAMRIFGLSSDYTFFTPIYHGFLISIGVYLSLFKKLNLFKYLPFILVAVVLNGRTGLILATGLSTFVFLAYTISNSSKLYDSLKVIVIVFLSLIIIINILETINPRTYAWIYSSFEELYYLLFRNEATGTFSTLDTMFLLPTGVSLLFGEGFRLYGNTKGLIHSDIGFVNDLFLGGILYTSILYTAQLIFFSKLSFVHKKYDRVILFSIFLATWLVSNYKGESSRGGLILIGMIITKFILRELYTESKES